MIALDSAISSEMEKVDMGFEQSQTEVGQSPARTTSASQFSVASLQTESLDLGQQPQQTEIWSTLVTPETAAQLGKTEKQIGELVERIVHSLGVTTMRVLDAVPEHILLRVGLPAAFCHFLRNGPRKSSESLSEVENYLWRFGFDAGLSAEEIRYVLQIVVEENWLESLDSLRSLPASWWNRLGLRDAMLVRKVQLLLEKSDAEWMSSKKSQSIDDVMNVIGHRIGRDSDTMLEYTCRLKKEGICTLSDLNKLTDAQFVNLKLPLRLTAELDLLRTDPACRTTPERPVPSCSAPLHAGSLHGEKVDTVYEEPDAATFVMRVGKRHNHAYSEIQVVADVLINQHWLTSVSKLRALSPQDWSEFYLSRKFVDQLQAGLTDPAMLGMTAVQYSPAPLDLFPCDVEFAIDQMFDEVPMEEHRDLARAFLRLVEILTLMPTDAPKRSIRKANPNFAQRSKDYQSVRLFLFALGYSDFDTHFLLPTLYMERAQAAHARLASLACQAYSCTPTTAIPSASNSTSAALFDKLAVSLTPSSSIVEGFSQFVKKSSELTQTAFERASSNPYFTIHFLQGGRPTAETPSTRTSPDASPRLPSAAPGSSEIARR